MAKIKLKLSATKSIDFNIQKFEKQHFPIKFLNSLSSLVLITFFILFARALVISQFDSVNFLYLLSTTTIFLLAIQVMKMLIGGIKYFPESVLDLFSLLLSIALISTLLTKQLFDLTRTDGMLPSESTWFMTILGVLFLLLFAYLVDITTRIKNRNVVLTVIFILAFELFVLIQAILGNTLPDRVYLIMLFGAVLLLPLVNNSSNRYINYAALVNILVLLTIGFINLDGWVLFLFMLVSSVLLGFGYFFKKFGVTQLKATKDVFAFLKRGQLRVAKVKAILPFVATLVAIVSYWLGLLIAGISGKVSLLPIKEGVNSIFDSIEATSSIQEVLLGSIHQMSYQSFVGNLFSTYGVVGLSIFVLFVSAFFSFVAKKYFQSSKKTDLFGYVVIGIIIFLTLLMFVSPIGAELLITYFVLIGLSLGAYGEDKKIKIEEGVFDLQKLKNIKVRYSLRFLQLLSIVLLGVLAVYFLLNTQSVLSNL